MNLVDDIKSILVTGVRENDLDQTVCQAISSRLTFKRISEIRPWILDSSMATQNNKTSDSNAIQSAVSGRSPSRLIDSQDQCQNFDHADGIRYAVRGFGMEDQY